MHWNTSLMSSGNPFLALRRDFERKLGLEADSVYAGMTVYETADAFCVDVDVPGMSQSEMNVTLHDDHLIIEGSRKSELPEGAKEVFNDRTFRSFRRVLRLQEPIQKESVEAELTNGVLKLKLRRAPEAQPHKIEIRTS